MKTPGKVIVGIAGLRVLIAIAALVDDGGSEGRAQSAAAPTVEAEGGSRTLRADPV